MSETSTKTETPTQLFFKKAKRRPWVIDIYVAIQAAMAFGVKEIPDFNDLADDIMPRPDRHPRAGYAIEEEGLAALGILFDCECIERGDTNYHEYKFTRKSDGKFVVGTAKI